MDSEIISTKLICDLEIMLWGALVLLKFHVNSQKLGVQAPQNFEFE